MSTVTLEQIRARQIELVQMIAQYTQPAASSVTITIEETDIELKPDERYAGLVVGPNDEPMHHLVLIADRPDKALNWQDAMAWATSVGGVLPTRQEQALLFANCKPHLEPKWHWSSETYAHDESYAWLCGFGNGGQGSYLRSYEGAAVAVRRV